MSTRATVRIEDFTSEVSLTIVRDAAMGKVLGDIAKAQKDGQTAQQLADKLNSAEYMIEDKSDKTPDWFDFVYHIDLYKNRICITCPYDAKFKRIVRMGD